MIKRARCRGLTPVVTFNHFTMPRWFAAQGAGVIPTHRHCSPDIVIEPTRFLAEQIGYALTLNEPNIEQTG